MWREKVRIGIDFGGVIVEVPTCGQRFNSSRWRATDGAFEVISELVVRTQGNVWIVSKADRATQRLTRAWLAENSFFQATGFNPANLRFCEKRADKLDICKELAITHFIDDSDDMVTALSGAVKHVYLFGKDCGPHGIAAVRGWRDFIAAVRDTSRLG